ncbi:hypothetical protein M422DRAFT_262790 [Sphaerobolus stellatus SS14]|uniref:Helitron helicase-like domain-containing protein n=1 Tax=Sphaerobolus stellatus (strain SS14) TaxID=990650 RepID=A0A0C9V0B3_SPHS4|nr:hypothetical protein M422DRAFT_262790 [Sphaerobolus stellatus SS14]
MQALQVILTNCNPYIQLYKSAREILEEQPNHSNLTLWLHFDATKDQRRYNAPTSTEVAALLLGPADQPYDKRDIILYLWGGGVCRIDEGSPYYTPLHYVLLFPKGEFGWHWSMRLQPGISGRHWRRREEEEEEDEVENDSENEIEGDHASQGRLTCVRFHAYRLHIKPEDKVQGLLPRGGRLLQQYVVDAWAQIEQSRLSWLQFNQNKLRAEVYNGLADALQSGDASLDNIGRQLVLPSSHIGSPRNMQQLYQDSMAICHKYIKPKWFVTATTNPAWKEITDELLPGQTPSDRPDLDGVLGKVTTFVCHIEFQKRGLPHEHSLYFGSPDDPIRSPEDVDKYICAYLPDEKTQGKLWDLVTRFMMHGPCGLDKPNALCMVDGKGFKGFPKSFQEETSLDGNGYPSYQRPNDGQFVMKDGAKLDNCHVVPYVPELILEFECHINVECCATVAGVKYIHKCVFKGPDHATVKVGDRENLNEIKQYLDARWIGSSEAVWRIFCNQMHAEKPTVYRLQFYLPNQQMIVFDPNRPEELITQQLQNSRTMLTEYFEANKKYPHARDYVYQDFPTYFTYNRSKKTWNPREKGDSIGRIDFTSPNSGERFYL